MRRTSSSRRRCTMLPAAVLAVAALSACARPRPAATAAAAPAAPAGGRKDSVRVAATMESANSLDESQFGQQPVNRVEELFVGRFPGVQVYSVNGQVQVRIRSAASINANTEPLILVDGQQLTPGSGGLIGLNPRDIRKIEVLKDAVSTAEFGVRGSNGVIKITTKRPD
ncbi:TonB-dependent receptor plug domain-containing protein [Gemmatimonas sp.]|uniref:TonB-dependent receptor plug domain-containing protein n=1 Tax=Gemmatimonas sp. TaxID=1962908 RepID=UPI0025BD9143|nr:TonB-dependent receptor plug domain-containing protein [Gemmatimonas sp.]MCA2991336.1 TonB-dependent receptor plug domain-containing protein [Gemmatimonas sp.]